MFYACQSVVHICLFMSHWRNQSHAKPESIGGFVSGSVFIQVTTTFQKSVQNTRVQTSINAISLLTVALIGGTEHTAPVEDEILSKDEFSRQVNRPPYKANH